MKTTVTDMQTPASSSTRFPSALSVPASIIPAAPVQAVSAAAPTISNPMPLPVAHATCPYPDPPPGTWQRCGDPPSKDIYHNMSTHPNSGDGISTTVPLTASNTDSPNLDPYYNMPKLIQSGDGASRDTLTTFSKPAPGPSPSTDSPPWRNTTYPNLKCGVHPQVRPPKVAAPATTLILFSGPKSNPVNLQHPLRKLNINVEAYDLKGGSNLADDAIWTPIKRKLESGFYAAVFASPPTGPILRVHSAYVQWLDLNVMAFIPIHQPTRSTCVCTISLLVAVLTLSKLWYHCIAWLSSSSPPCVITKSQC